MYLALTLALSLNIPLGEAPDEPAHFRYARFIAAQGRLPVNQPERDAVGYRGDKPPLYHSLVALMLTLVPPTEPDALRPLYTEPRRLLPFDGLPDLVFLHTADEVYPFRGVARAWHAARLVSVGLGGATVWVIFAALRRRFPGGVSLPGALVIGVIPQFLIMNGVVNDDSLLGLLAAIFFRLLWPLISQRGGGGRGGRYLALGLVAGLALTTKYSALPLPISLLALHLITRRPISLRQGGLFLLGYGLGSIWWFGFVALYFNQLETLGGLSGLLAPFLIEGSDLTSHRVAGWLGLESTAGPVTAPIALDWGGWSQALLTSFWFDGRALGNEIWWAAAAITLGLGLGLGLGLVRRSSGGPVKREIWLGVIVLLSFLLLPALRYLITGNIAETAQGRHLLFPALLPLAILLPVSLGQLTSPRRTGVALLALGGGLILGLIAIWPRVTYARLPPFPIETALSRPPDIPLGHSYADTLTLVGLNRPNQTHPAAIPLTLIWQAEQVPTQDYGYRLTLYDDTGATVGIWQGQPLNGRLPTRAWDAGDTVIDPVWLPHLPGVTGGTYTLTLEVLDGQGEPVPTDAGDHFRLNLASPIEYPPLPESSWQLIPRSDGLPAGEPYHYRSTLGLVGVAGGAVRLVAPDGRTFDPLLNLNNLTNAQGAIVLFTVGWNWPAGEYALVAGKTHQTDFVTIATPHRLSEPPPISRPLEANFGDQIKLLGYDLPQTRVEPGASFPIRLIWQSLRRTSTHYKVFNHLLAPDQRQAGGQDRIPRGLYSTVLWEPGEVVVDEYPVPVAVDAPDGIYWLDVGLYPATDPTAPALPLVQSGVPLDLTGVRLGPIKVGGQPAAAKPPAGEMQPRSEQFGALIALDGFTRTVTGAHDLSLGLRWSAMEPISTDYTLFIHLVDEQGDVVRQADGPPVQGLYPTSFWETGEQIFDPRRLSLTGLPAGEFELRLGWYEPDSGLRLAVPGNLAGFVVLDRLQKSE